MANVSDAWDDEDLKDSLRLALENLARAYGEEEPEYPVNFVKEFKPSFPTDVVNKESA